MTPSELRAAAKKTALHLPTLIAWLDREQMLGRWDGKESGVQQDLRKFVQLANHILSTVRDDDDEAVTVEWCDSTSLPQISRYTGIRQYFIVAGVSIWSQENHEGGWATCELSRRDQSDFKYVAVTRGQVRDLCRALQIELKETP